MNSRDRFISEFLENHPKEVLKEIIELKSLEIAELVQGLNKKDQKIIIEGLNSRKSAKVLEKMSRDTALDLLIDISFPNAEAILRRMEKSLRDNLLNKLPNDLSQRLKYVLTFEKDKIGAYINPYVLTLSTDMTVEKALKFINNDTDLSSNKIFVLDEERKLSGQTHITAFMKTSPEKLVKAIMKPVSFKLMAEMPVKEVIENWQDEEVELAVTNISNEFLGVITRGSLNNKSLENKDTNYYSAVSAGNALADLYFIGISSLIGGSGSNTN